MFKLDLEKVEETEIKLPTSIGTKKKKENSRKTCNYASLTTLKPLTVWITTNWKILKEVGIPDSPDLPPEKSVCRLRSNSRNWTWNNRLVPNWEKSMSRLYIVTLLI